VKGRKLYCNSYKNKQELIKVTTSCGC